MKNPSMEDVKAGYIAQFRKLRKPDLVVALARGGLFGGVLASHYFGVPMESVAYSAKAGNGGGIGEDFNLEVEGADRILVVDDIADTGETLSDVVAYLRKNTPHVDSVVAHCRPTAVFQPTASIWHLGHSDSEWVFYPWEVHPDDC